MIEFGHAISNEFEKYLFYSKTHVHTDNTLNKKRFWLYDDIHSF